MSWNRRVRKIHYWGAFGIALPLLVVILSGVLLQVKKQVAWVQPPTQRGRGVVPTLAFDQLLTIAQTVPQAQLQSWEDIDRLDIRPGKGVVKIRAKNRWEIQLDHQTGDILQVAYRRSDLIESIHDGSFFHKGAKLWIFLPSAIVLLALWLTGMYMFILPFKVKSRRKRKERQVSQYY